MCSYGVGEVCTGAGEWDKSRTGVNSGSGAGGDGRIMGVETSINNELVEVRGFQEMTEEV